MLNTADLFCLSRYFMRVLQTPGLLCDLLWSDPEREVDAWGENDRGVSFTFGPKIVENFLKQHDFNLVCRAHQASFSFWLAMVAMIVIDTCIMHAVYARATCKLSTEPAL